MLNEEMILREAKKCFYRDGEEETFEKNEFLMENIVAKVAGLFESDDKIFWCGHEKNVNIWAATPVKSPASIKLWDLFGPSDAKLIFLMDKRAVYINVMRMLEEDSLTWFDASEIQSIICGYYWTRKRDEISSRAVRIVTEEQSEFYISVNISNNSYNALLKEIHEGSESPIKEKIIVLDDSDSIKKYHSTSIHRRKSWSKTNI